MVPPPILQNFSLPSVLSIDTTIDPDGDVILSVSPRSRLLVSSKILSAASAFFAAKFSSCSFEGRSLSSLNPIKVTLPVGCPTAVKTICNILHFHHDLVKPKLSFDEIYEIALVADKYNLAPALGPWREVWSRLVSVYTDVNRQGKKAVEEREIFIRYAFADRDGFRAVTKEAILWGDGTEEWEYEELLCEVGDCISEARTKALEALIQIAESIIQTYQSSEIKCELHSYSPFTSALILQPRMCDDAVLGSLVRLCKNIGISPMPSEPYCGLSVRGLAMALKNLKSYVHCITGHGSCGVTGRVSKMVDSVLATVKGLELADFKVAVEEKGVEGSYVSIEMEGARCIKGEE